MIEIKVILTRADSNIFAVGEVVECLIKFTNVVETDDNEASNSSEDNLAWASAQLQGYRKTNSEKPNDKVAELTEQFGKTTLDSVTQAPGDVILDTKPQILFCDLKLKPGEKKHFMFREFLPRKGPPTYRGHNIRYFYRVTVAAQRVKSKVQTITVPIRVLPIPIFARPVDFPCTEETNDNLTPTNPFVEKREITELELSWDHIKNITARRNPKYYRISNKRGFVGRFCLFKHNFRLGEDIVGTLEFTNCQVRCVQYLVKLQCQEHLLGQNSSRKNSINDNTDAMSLKSLDLNSVTSVMGNEPMHKSSTAGSVKLETDDIDDIDDTKAKLTTLSMNHELCIAMEETYILLPIPLDATPSFRTDMVDVRWRLHFEFVTSTMMDYGELPESGCLMMPEEIQVETMVWDLPITVFSADPLKIYRPPEEFKLLVK